jgi:hypothetical protein
MNADKPPWAGKGGPPEVMKTGATKSPGAAGKPLRCQEWPPYGINYAVERAVLAKLFSKQRG